MSPSSTNKVRYIRCYSENESKGNWTGAEMACTNSNHVHSHTCIGVNGMDSQQNSTDKVHF